MKEQLLEAGLLLGVGMTVVFCFLTLLIGGIHSIAWFARTFPEPEQASSKKHPSYTQTKNNNKTATPTTVNPTIIAAITAAVHTHRKHSK